MNPRELGELFEKYDADLRRYLWRLTGRTPDDDLVADFWTKLLESPDKYDPERPFLPWAFAVLQNLSITNHNYAQRKKRGGDMKRNGEDAEIPDHRLADPRHEAITEELAIALKECLDRHGTQFRLAMQLHYWEGCTWEAVGNQLMRSKAWAPTKLYRYTPKLKECLEARGYNAEGDFYAD